MARGRIGSRGCPEAEPDLRNQPNRSCVHLDLSRTGSEAAFFELRRSPDADGGRDLVGESQAKHDRAQGCRDRFWAVAASFLGGEIIVCPDMRGDSVGHCWSVPHNSTMSRCLSLYLSSN